MVQISIGAESKSQNEGTNLSRRRTIRKSRRDRKKKLVNVLKKLHVKEEKNIEEYGKALINKSFVGDYLYDKLNINVCNLNKLLTNNYSTISQHFQSKQLELHKSCLNIKKFRDLKRTKADKPRKLTQINSFSQEYKRLRELLGMIKFRILTYIEGN